MTRRLARAARALAGCALFALLVLLALLALPLAAGEAERPFLLLASTTSTRDSGLLAELTKRFEAESGIAVRVLATGTGRALEHGRRGDVDALLVHDQESELAFVAEGHGLFRCEVMYNDFVLLGPSLDPAEVFALASVTLALRRIAERGARFLSRGDDSGTHKAERRLWRAARLDPRAERDRWYLESGNGMGATLNMASELDAYLLADRGTWLSHKRRGQMALLVEGDPLLHNPYGVLALNPARHPQAKLALARRFSRWLLSPEGQATIKNFERDGQPLFFPVAKQVQQSCPPGR